MQQTTQDVSYRKSGFSLLEVVAGMVFLTIGLLGVGIVFVANQRSYEAALQESLVTHQFRYQVESIRSTPFDAIAAAHQGTTFTVDEINGTGTVTVFVNESATGPDAVELGLPRDLDGDGATTTADVSGNYVLLPIKLEVTWTAMDGPQTRSHYFYISDE